MTLSAIFAIIVGAGMIGQWTLSFLTHQIPELQSEPIRIGFHIAGEMATALALITGGVGLLASLAWARVLFLVAMGMLFYTAIVSPGYFAQKGQWIWVVIFGIIIVLAIVAVMNVAGSNHSAPTLSAFFAS